MKLWGPKWDGTPAGDECERVETPAGSECWDCGTSISAEQSGATMPYISMEDDYSERPIHRLCLLMNVLGPGWENLARSDGLYDAARDATDAVLGDGSYAETNGGNPDPRVQAAIRRGQQ